MAKLNINNSIYQNANKGANVTVNNGGLPGLPVEGGRLINNRPNGQMGITQMAEMRKALRKGEKISMYADATAMGIAMGKMRGCSDCM